MSSFTTPLELEYIDGSTWKLTAEFDYRVSDAADSPVIHVPAGFVTDFASIPRVFWDVLPPTGKYGKAAVIHDFLYVTGGKVDGKQVYSKADADRIFRDAMAVLGVPAWKRWVMWSAVSAFGKGNFDGR